MIGMRAVLAAAIVLCSLGATPIAEAQRPGRIPQLCFLTFDPGTARSLSPRFAAFFQGLREPTKFDLVIDMETVKALGLTIPASLLVRAAEIIE